MIFNNILWRIYFVPKDSFYLLKGDNTYSLGVCDADNKNIYINKDINSSLIKKVIVHELCHALLYSYNISFNSDIEQEFFINSLIKNGKNLY